MWPLDNRVLIRALCLGVQTLEAAEDLLCHAMTTNHPPRANKRVYHQRCLKGYSSNNQLGNISHHLQSSTRERQRRVHCGGQGYSWGHGIIMLNIFIWHFSNIVHNGLGVNKWHYSHCIADKGTVFVTFLLHILEIKYCVVPEHRWTPSAVSAPAFSLASMWS